MNFIGAINPLYSISGFAVGVLVGMTGVGAGLFGSHPRDRGRHRPPHAAATKSGGSLIHGLSHTIRWGAYWAGSCNPAHANWGRARSF